MERFDPGAEQRNILRLLSKGNEMTVDEIYRALGRSDTSSFSYYSDGNTEQRRLVSRLLYFLRNRKGAVRNDGQQWSLSPDHDESDESGYGEMPPFDTNEERDNILHVIRTASQPDLGDIHSGLVEMDRSVFKSLPTVGWNEERHLLIALRDTLRENEGLITNEIGGNDRTWSLTPEGKQKVE